MQNLILIGGGGHCRACIDVIEQGDRFTIAGIVDMPAKKQQTVLGYSVIGSDADLTELVKGCPNVLITLGQIKSPTRRMELFNIAKTGKPVILSTGMSTLGEVEAALGVLAFGYLFKNARPSLQKFQDAYCSEKGQDILAKKVTLLHCNTEYPTPFDEVNLQAMATMRAAFGLPVGLSDHTPGIAVPIAAVALGAAVVEKHF